MSSGLNVPRPAIPIPAFDVPNAAPTADSKFGKKHGMDTLPDVLLKTI